MAIDQGSPSWKTRLWVSVLSRLRQLGLWRSIGVALLLWLALLLAINALYPIDVQGYFLSALVILFYILPLLLAFDRRHEQRLIIGTLNVLLGWTVLGWFALLFWSLIQDDRSTSGSTTP